MVPSPSRVKLLGMLTNEEVETTFFQNVEHQTTQNHSSQTRILTQHILPSVWQAKFQQEKPHFSTVLSTYLQQKAKIRLLDSHDSHVQEKSNFNDSEQQAFPILNLLISSYQK